MSVPIELALFLLLLALAVVVTKMKDLFAAAMLFGIFSLLSAGLFTLMDAVDVAFTEAAVGAGISTILLLCTLALTETKEDQGPLRLLPFVVVGLTGAALLYGTADMPVYGDIAAPVHNDVTAEFIAGTEEVHIPNVVTVVLASYRGYDTFGETTVIFTAAIGVMLLLGGTARRRRTRPDGLDTPAVGVPPVEAAETPTDPAGAEDAQ
jgi:multicomponent Na+:H+ antiporter subunit B